MSANYPTDIRIAVGRWAHDPCHRCGRQPAAGELVSLDWLAHVVTCRECIRADQRAFADALARCVARVTRAPAKSSESLGPITPPQPISRRESAG